MNTWKILGELKPVVLMVLVQIAYAAANVFYKIATNDGMSVRVVTSYRLMVGAVFCIPLALVLERFIHVPFHLILLIKFMFQCLINDWNFCVCFLWLNFKQKK